MCQGFSHFQRFLHHLVLTKLATSSVRVSPDVNGLIVIPAATGPKGLNPEQQMSPSCTADNMLLTLMLLLANFANTK